MQDLPEHCMRLIVLFMFFVCNAAVAGEAPPIAPVSPLACPQCGEWDLVTASFGLTGEKIVITPERVEMPVLGSFCASVLSKTVSHEYGIVRGYRMTLNLAAGDICAVPDEDSLRMDVSLPPEWQTEGSIIKIAVYQASSGDALLSATGWNRMRKDPCDNGGGRPGIDCLTIEHATTFKRLAYLMYVLQKGERPREVTQLARRFNVTRFAGAVEIFCTRREVESDAGAPVYWSIACQHERLDGKLREWQAWSTCRALAKRKCTMPTEQFDKSKREL